ncbi:TetR/AcrR family transcriptional regulator [Sphingomonas colocasiae]|uniref:TetR/AcrR family transcriptional regulator n=1 Tax=Sphingomonas colocasiae TaxID=1848973 RepID=A0ABS7PRF6_9SPHN|nr:TetR/AcrR family transcriptional regulator [Sphingomonas colocasiae]MBY8823564.1 TetR/AcrR family transcriptional regulator [Sphingomonas colocasiae]
MTKQQLSRRVEPRKLPSRSNSRARVEAILAATRELIFRHGLEGLTTNQIAEHAGIPVGSVYQYFPNKQAIVYALIQDWLSVLEDKLDAFPMEDYLQKGRDYALQQMSMTVTVPSTFDYERKLGRILLGAIDLYPELRELNDAHVEFCVESSVKFLKAAGSKWSVARLRKLGRYILEIRRTLYYTPDEIVADAIKWQEIATIAIISQCLDD